MIQAFIFQLNRQDGDANYYKTTFYYRNGNQCDRGTNQWSSLVKRELKDRFQVGIQSIL